jgi:hypothetical protein
MKIKLKSVLSIFVIFMMMGLLPIAAWAQKTTISGKITDPAGQPIPGASIMLKGTTIGTISDIDGKYSLQLDNANDGVLIVSYIGMKSVELPLNGQMVYDVN